MSGIDQLIEYSISMLQLVHRYDATNRVYDDDSIMICAYGVYSAENTYRVK